MNRMYDDFAHLWPLISHHADYADEAKHWRAVLDAKLGDPDDNPDDRAQRPRILELGVGGGNNLHHILYPDCAAPRSPSAACECRQTPRYDAHAVDLSDKMLANSRALNPSVQHHLGDMRSARLGVHFDAVLIHDAICYMMSENDIRATLRTARAHLRPGGVLIMAPDWFTETYPGTQISARVRRDDSAPHFASVEYDYDPDPTDNALESVFIYFVKGEDGRVRVEEDRHITGIFSIQTWLSLMRQAGFAAERVPYPVHDDGSDGYLLVGVLQDTTPDA